MRAFIDWETINVTATRTHFEFTVLHLWYASNKGGSEVIVFFFFFFFSDGGAFRCREAPTKAPWIHCTHKRLLRKALLSPQIRGPVAITRAFETTSGYTLGGGDVVLEGNRVETIKNIDT